MQKSHALRHLLLRRLWRLQGRAPEAVYREVTGSLRVERDGSGFVVSWSREGRGGERRFGPEDFLLYARGDAASSPGADGRDRANDERAEAFAREALGLESASAASRARSLFPNAGATIMGTMLLSVATGWLAGPASGLLLAALYVLEYAGTRMKVVCALLFGAWAALGLFYAALLGAAAYGAFQFLDPSPEWRRSRVAAAAAAFTAALYWGPALPVVDVRLILIVAVSAALFTARWLCGLHFRSMPLTLPFLCVGFYLDGRPELAALGLAVAAAGAAFSRWGWHVLPVRRRAEAFQHTMRPLSALK